MAGEIYFNNLTGRFDWGSIIDQIIRLKSIPIQRLSQEAQQVQARQSALQGLTNAVGDLSKLFENLNVDDLFRGKRANSSDSSVLTATSTENTPNVTINLSVSKLAQKEVLVTNEGISDINSSISWSAFQIAYNTGNSFLYFDVQAGSGKLSDLVSAINSAAGGKIVASTFYDGSQYKLMLSERDEASSTAETGEGNTVISFNLPPVINGNTWNLDTTNPLQSAQNAQISIGSNTLTSPSNRFENIIDGLSVEVKKQGNATITVNEDYSAVSKFLGDFVRSYNAVISQVNQLTGRGALFQGDYTITGIKTELSRMLDKLFANDLVNVKEDGTLEINSSAVNSLASSNPQRLREVITNLKDTMGGYSLRTNTTLQTFSNDLQNRFDAINRRAQDLGQQLIREEERLRLEYARVEAFINKAQETMARLQAFIVSLSEMQGGNRR
ncbi:flagellar filament capping protein FliD [Hydrogenobacter sp. T-2]|uniref:flagellar filament capping protein FliD n=1 Tax=Pampinifervens diazotrophicum TaxID=1632018 RepID=UPI002B25F207|nr:flagellar filament capping protein FliD [Hydrogenobacter sp. T-2]WPM32373.1 flagellar filament capping protein FliD [Hydrogenobacter sp. T-2]